jgi:CRP/FNR family transcriptional regulator
MATSLSSCAACAVRDQALCSVLGESDLAALNAMGRRQSLARGETLAWAGDASVVCGNLLSGVLKLAASTADGDEQIVGLIYPSDFVGRPYASSNDYSITALTPAELCVFPRLQFEKMLSNHVEMERLLLQRTLAALDAARARMLMLGRQSASAKVAGFLLEMVKHDGGCRASAFGPITFDLPLSRGQMADVLGLTIETVSRQMTKLKVAGTIALPGGRTITIIDRGALQQGAAV